MKVSLVIEKGWDDYGEAVERRGSSSFAYEEVELWELLAQATEGLVYAQRKVMPRKERGSWSYSACKHAHRWKQTFEAC